MVHSCVFFSSFFRRGGGLALVDGRLVFRYLRLEISISVVLDLFERSTIRRQDDGLVGGRCVEN